MNRKLLQEMESYLFLRQNSNLKDLVPTFHTIILKEDYLNYRRNCKYTSSFDVLIYLRYNDIEYEICELDTTRPILSKFVIDRSNLSKKVRDKINAFEQMVDAQ